MNKELLKNFYDQAITKCEEGDAWEFERHFAQAIAEYCADICLDLGTAIAGVSPTAPFDDCAYQIKKEFNL